MRGPKPKELKILQGTFREDRDGPIDELVLADGEPAPPPGMNGDALKYWRRIVPVILRLGVACEIDSDELSAMCDWYGLYRKAVKTAKAAKGNDPNLIRKLMAASMAWKQFDRIAARFGLTPADRAKLKVESKPKEVDPMEAFLKGGKRAKA